MRSIQLTEEFAEHFTEVLIIGDIGEELTISRAVIVPVDAVEIDIVELLLDLLPSMVEDISTFGSWAMLKLSCEADGLEATAIELVEPRRSTNIDRLTILTKHQATTTDTSTEELRGLLLEVTFPEIVGIFILSDVVELRTIIGDDSIRKRTRSARQANGTIIQISKVRGEGSSILLILSLSGLLRRLLRGLLIIRLLILVVQLGDLLTQLLVFLRELEVFVGLTIEEHQVVVTL